MATYVYTLADGSTWTPGTDEVLGAGYAAFSGEPTVIATGTVGAAAMTLRRAVHVSLRDDNGSPLRFELEAPAADAEPQAVRIDDTLVMKPEGATFVGLGAYIVSTAAVRLAQGNTRRKTLVIANAGGGTLYVGNTKSVTASGPGLGLIVPSLGSLSDFGTGIVPGEWWGIYSATASAENVTVLDVS